jgi:enediyne polyketide synthase
MTGGITAPKVEGQMRALENAYKIAGYPISSVQLFEGHGTGTPVGDVVELETMKRLLDKNKSKNISRIGSIKSNIGHCKAAAGVMGIIKAAMALNRKIYPPTMNCSEPNPAFGTPLTNLEPSVKPEAWKDNGQPRRASVSGMGFGGSNGHVTLEESNPNDKPDKNELELLLSSQKTEIILLDADSVEKLHENVKKLIPVSDRISRAELTDLAAALAKRIEKRKIRLAIIAESPWHLHDLLINVDRWLDEKRDMEEINNPFDGIFIGEAKDNVKIAGLFPGQGSHFINMGEQLKDRYPFIDNIYNKSDESLKDIFKEGLTERIFTNIFRLTKEQHKSFENTLKNTGTAQPAIVLSSMAMLKILEYFGVQPDICLGHSLGEISAMAASGYFNDHTAVQIAALRGKSKTDLDIPDPGAMAATVAPPEKVEEILKEFKDDIIAVANYNSPTQTVVSGSTDAVKRFEQKCKEKDYAYRLIPVSHAFHSDIVATASIAFEKSLNDLGLKVDIPKVKRKIRFISTATGDFLNEDVEIVKLLSEHIRKPVRFIEAVEKANEQKPDLWLEIGPGGILSGLVKSILGNETKCLTSNIRNEELFSSLNHLLGQCFVSGVNIKTERLFKHRFYREFDPDNYNPVFITNPCERKIDIEKLGIKETPLFGSSLLPEHEDVNFINNYLEQRKDFIKDFIELDFKHFVQAGIKQPANYEIKTKLELPEKKEDKKKTKEDYVDFAIGWISKRIGIPVNRIKPEMKLGDDLNLDSIRAGELVIVLAKELKAVKTIADPAVYANSRITDIIDQIEINAKKEGEHQGLSNEQINVYDESITTSHWFNTFAMQSIEYPVNNETAHPLNAESKLTIVCPDTDKQALALKQILKQKNVDTEIIAWDKATEIKPETDALLIILPETDKLFYEHIHDDFHKKSESTLLKVFGLLKSCLVNSFTFPDGFRCMIVDQYKNEKYPINESTAFHAFLKSLKLEHKVANFKMLSLPVQLKNKNEIIINELEHFSERIRIEHHKGKRFTRVAAPINEYGNQELSLNSNDVVLVSGGGKGITFQHALALGREYDVKLALLGTSPQPTPSDEKENELTVNLNLLIKENIKHIYVQCDITDPESVKKAFAITEKKLSTVTGLFHGAGISKFNLFKDKSFEEFFECFRVKAYGLYNMISACQPGNIKMLHVISSVLGHTGMRSQSDYTFANSWLDIAVDQFKQNHQHIHCLTLGYTVWGETGLGKRSGALDFLKTVGVHSLKIEEGISSYIHLLTKVKKEGAFVITGRLSNDLEANLYAPLSKMKGRFLEHILRFVPQTEIATECTLSHETDLYLQEHIYNGTPLMPAVMEIEAMVQAVLQCMGTTRLQVLKNIRLYTPIIIPKGEQVKIRIMATAKYNPGETPVFDVMIKTDTDQFSKKYIEAEAIFEAKISIPANLQTCPELTDPLPVNPNELSPYPLFQGKLFRRIENIYKQEFEKDCITTIKVPDGEQYFADGYDKEIYFGSPAVRDSLYQSGLLIVSEGSLPDVIPEIRVFKNLEPGNNLVFKLCSLIKNNSFEYEVSFVAFNQNGEMVGYEEVLLKKPSSGSLEPPRKKIKPISIDRIESDLESLMPENNHALAILSKSDLKTAIKNGVISDEEINQLKKEFSEQRLQTVIANLLVTRRAAIKFAEKQNAKTLKNQDIQLKHRKDGKPVLSISDTYNDKKIFAGMDISIVDSGTSSVAFIGAKRVGVDLELLEYRDAETWLGLLGRDGYDLACELTETTNENFDISATRVWTLIEAYKKSNDLKKEIPIVQSFKNESCLEFTNNSKDKKCYSILITDDKSNFTLFSIVHKQEVESLDNKSKSTQSSAFVSDKYGIISTELFLTFKDCKSKSGRTFFTNYPVWMGYLRELALQPIGDRLVKDMISGKWGLVTNHSRISIFNDALPFQKVTGLIWMTKKSKLNDSYINILFEWFKEENGEQVLLARCELATTWVEIVGFGKVKKAPLPPYFLEYLQGLPQLDSKNETIFSSSYLSLNNLRNSLYKSYIIPKPEILLSRNIFKTSIDDGNAVGNIYFSNYYNWQASLIDLFMLNQFSDYFVKSKGTEYISLECSVDHLLEAMPFEEIVVNMYLLELFENGITFFFEYFIKGNESNIKIATGINTIIFAKRDSNTGVLNSIDIPGMSIKKILNQIKQ